VFQYFSPHFASPTRLLVAAEWKRGNVCPDNPIKLGSTRFWYSVKDCVIFYWIYRPPVRLNSMRLRDYLVIIFLIVLFGLVGALCCYAGPAESGIPAEQIIPRGWRYF
jgi:hypothetical protein